MKDNKKISEMSQDEYWSLMWKTNKKTLGEKKAEEKLQLRTLPIITCVASVIAALCGIVTVIYTIFFQ